VSAIKFFKASACGLLLVSFGTLAQVDDSALQTDWMEFVKGARDSASGAEVVDVEEGGEDGVRTVTLSIPKTSVSDPAAIEEVVVIGQAPEKDEPGGLNISYEWVSDYDEDNYGLIIRLSEDTNWPIRLYLNSSPGFVR
jgi:hypothetical protein